MYSLCCCFQQQLPSASRLQCFVAGQFCSAVLLPAEVLVRFSEQTADSVVIKPKTHFSRKLNTLHSKQRPTGCFTKQPIGPEKSFVEQKSPNVISEWWVRQRAEEQNPLGYCAAVKDYIVCIDNFSENNDRLHSYLTVRLHLQNPALHSLGCCIPPRPYEQSLLYPPVALRISGSHFLVIVGQNRRFMKALMPFGCLDQPRATARQLLMSRCLLWLVSTSQAVEHGARIQQSFTADSDLTSVWCTVPVDSKNKQHS